MIIQQEAATIDRSAGLTESAFAMDATASAFDILSSGLYSDKPKAVVRELACNAHDSHVAAGYPQRPIEIHLPSTLDLTFYVKDYGTGLTDYEVRGGWHNPETDEQVSDLDVTMTAEEYLAAGFVRATGIYNTYFRSTKTKSNDFIGQLGLGSKSPYSYAATFNVEVRKDGIVRMYVCYKNEAGTPVITLMSSQETSEENGITISMAVRREDVDKFRIAARSALMYFNPTPDVRGVQEFKPYDMVHTVKGSNWRVRKSEYYAYMNGPYVVQGFVAYPVDVELLVEGGLSGIAAKVAKTDIDLYVPIGAARPAASREALQYDRRTVVNLIEALNQAAAEVRQSFQTEFDTATSMYEAAVMYDKFTTGGTEAFKTLFGAMSATQPFTWRDQQITPTIMLDVAGLEGITLIKTSVNQPRKGTLKAATTWVSGAFEKVHELAIQSNMHFIYSDRPNGMNQRIRAYQDSLPKVDGRYAQIVLVKARDKKQAARAETSCKAIADQLSVVFKPVSELPEYKTTRAPSITKRRNKTARYVWSGYLKTTSYWGRTEVRRKFSRQCWDLEEIAIEDGGLYMPITGFAVDAPARIGTHFDEFLALGVAQNIIKTTAIVGLTSKELAEAQASGGKWVNVFDLLTKEMKKSVNVDQMMASRVVAQVAKGTTQSVSTLHKRFAEGAIAVSKDNKLREFLEHYDTVVNNASKLSSTEIDRLVNYTNVVVDPGPTTQKLLNKWKEASEAYPLFTTMNWDSTASENIKAMVQYMNLVDNSVDVTEKLSDSNNT